MCGCFSQPGKSVTASDEAAAILVEDMSCGHCARSIEQAVKTALPGLRIEADPETKQVRVWAAMDLPAVEHAIRKAGYTPGLTGLVHPNL